MNQQLRVVTILRVIIWILIISSFGGMMWFFADYKKFQASLSQGPQCVWVGHTKPQSFENITVYSTGTFTTNNLTYFKILIHRNDRKKLKGNFQILKKDQFCKDRYNLYALGYNIVKELIIPNWDLIKKDPHIAANIKNLILGN